MALTPAPHSDEWFLALAEYDPQQAAHTRAIVAAAGRADVCSTCGDDPTHDFELVGPMPPDEAVATIRLCDDCHQLRSMQGEVFRPYRKR